MGNVFGRTQRILKETYLHTQIVEADIKRRIGVSERVQGHILVHLADLFAQLEIVLIPVKDNAAQTGIIFNKLQQIVAVVRVNNAEIEAFKGTMQFTDGLLFEVNAHVIHDSNNVHNLISG